MADCLFCRIVAGEVPATQVHEDDLVIAFRDIAPRSPTHILLIPRRHIASAAVLTEADGPLARSAVRRGGADRPRRGDRGRRATGSSPISAWGGQTVDHLHFHLMGGRPFAWPPG